MNPVLAVMPGLAPPLLEWGRANLRDFPWRRTDEPYRIFVAEFLLQRTRASRVVPVYNRLVRQFPGFGELAGAEEDEILSILYPLGLHRRGGLMRDAAQAIVERFGGNVPGTMEELTSIPGIGLYTAAAILVSVHGKPAPVADTNVLRVLARVSGAKLKDSSRKSPEVLRAIESMIPAEAARAFTYAILDLGATICTPKNPACHRCPLADICVMGRTHGVQAVAG